MLNQKIQLISGAFYVPDYGLWMQKKTVNITHLQDPSYLMVWKLNPTLSILYGKQMKPVDYTVVYLKSKL